MAKRKRQPAPDPVNIQSPEKKKNIGLYTAIALTLVLAGIPFALGKYIEFNSPGPFDSGAYVYSAKHLLEGARLGVDEQASAQPGTLIANLIGVKLLGFSDTGPKIVQMLLQLAAGVFMFYTLRRVFGSVAAVLATTIAAVYLSAPLIAKFGNVKEQFMIAFMLYAGCSFLLYEFTKKRCWLLLTGFLALQPFYFKATGISVVIAIVFYIIGSNLVTKKWKNLCREMLYFLGGYAAGLVIPLTLFLWQNQPSRLLNTFPFVALQIGLIVTLGLIAVVYSGGYLSRFMHWRDFKKVSKHLWIGGTAVLLMAVIVSILMIRLTSGVQKGDIRSYIESIPFISIPRTIISTVSHKIMSTAKIDSGYLAGARAAINFSDVTKKIMRYYMALRVPVLLALVSIITAATIRIVKHVKKTTTLSVQSGLIGFLAVWWLLDMAFVWVSPRSYEEYYLPLCASAAMLSAYLAWMWACKLTAATNKMPWLAAGFAAAVLLIILAVPIFAGQKTSPDTGADYGERRRGYAQSLARVKQGGLAPWQAVGDYIRTNSDEKDKIYVWGWVPGIYVQAQRLAPVPKAFESDMHVMTPRRLEILVSQLVEKMQQQPPKFIVDTRKRHVPWNRPPLELWPIVPPKLFGNDRAYYLRNDERETAAFDTWYANQLKTNIDEQEALRYQAMKPFRDFVMTHYKPVSLQAFGDHRLYERTTGTPAP
jgi:4-amino-4-deoxy-L-arabinose transferase-like glycosyltransferase